MNKNEELARRLKYWRKNKNHTQDSLADLTDMTRKAISAYENAKSFISYGAAKKIADALGISPLYLLCETDDPYETNSEYAKKTTKTFSVSESKDTDKLPVFLWEALKATNSSLEPPVDFYLKPSNCEGDFWVINASTTMDPTILKDDYLLVSKAPSVLKDGDVVLFKVNKKTDIMYYTETQEYYLLYPSKCNRKPVVVFKNKAVDFSIIGKITAFLRKTS
jgi:transcriptional regulator with XRE-family HTH domain